MAYLRLLSNPADDSAFLRIVNTPRRGIGATSLEKLAELGSLNQCPLFEAISDSRLTNYLKSKQSATLRQFAEMMGDIVHQAHGANPVEAAHRLLEEIGYERWLMETCETEVAKRRWENVGLLMEWLEKAELQSTENVSLVDLINELILTDILDKQSEEEQDVVNLMTLHAAKGLEFKNVYIVGVEEDILPHRVSISEGGDEEERRLFYVGITRAMQKLTLSYAARRKRFGDQIECDPSRFISEMPSEDLNWVRLEGEVNEAEQKDLGRAYLAKIRAGRT